MRPNNADEGDGVPSASGQLDPRFQEMQAALAAFDATGGSAPARERAFYSALRTLLSEVAAEMSGPNDITGSGKQAAQTAAKLAAAHKWFIRSK